MWREGRIQKADREEMRYRYGLLRRSARKALGRATLHLLEELKSREGRDDYFKGIHCPVAVVGGAQDEIVPNSVQELLATSITGEPPIILDDCGHAVAQEQPTKLLRLLVKFLGTLPCR